MFGLRLTIDAQPRSKNGQPAQNTTGVASTQADPVQRAVRDRRAAGPPGTMSAMASTNTGSASTRARSRSGASCRPARDSAASSSVDRCAARAPCRRSGRRLESADCTSGCMGQHVVRARAGGFDGRRVAPSRNDFGSARESFEAAGIAEVVCRAVVGVRNRRRLLPRSSSRRPGPRGSSGCSCRAIQRLDDGTLERRPTAAAPHEMRQRLFHCLKLLHLAIDLRDPLLGDGAHAARSRRRSRRSFRSASISSRLKPRSCARFTNRTTRTASSENSRYPDTRRGDGGSSPRRS